MKAVQARYEARGQVPQDVIAPATVDLPAPAAGQALAAVLAAGQATYPVERIREAVAAATAGERDGKILVVPA